jgi:hypothetical protein
MSKPTERSQQQRQQQQPGAQLRRVVIERSIRPWWRGGRDVFGRPITTAPLRMGAEQRILEAGALKVACHLREQHEARQEPDPAVGF